VACRALKPTSGGVLHIHDNVSTFGGKSKEEKMTIIKLWSKSVISELQVIFNEIYSIDWMVNELLITKIKSYAPHIDHLVLDVECRPPL
jgi:tRNA G37 N-methylase Trm5